MFIPFNSGLLQYDKRLPRCRPFPTLVDVGSRRTDTSGPEKFRLGRESKVSTPLTVYHTERVRVLVWSGRRRSLVKGESRRLRGDTLSVSDSWMTHGPRRFEHKSREGYSLGGSRPSSLPHKGNKVVVCG